MRRLVLFCALLLALSSPAKANSVARWQSYIAEASLRFGIPENWIVRVMRAESGGKRTLNGRLIRSQAGAMGLMQIMPATWTQLRRTHDLGTNPDDPRANILGGTAYLRDLYDRFGYPGLFAAYNAGPGRYRAYLKGRKQLPAETISYVRAVTGRSDYVRSVMPQSVVTERSDTLFYDVQSTVKSHTTTPQSRRSEGLFVIRRSSDGDSQ